jgi:hypothetical protein
VISVEDSSYVTTSNTIRRYEGVKWAEKGGKDSQDGVVEEAVG